MNYIQKNPVYTLIIIFFIFVPFVISGIFFSADTDDDLEKRKKKIF
jgi:hypothetical protein